MLEGIIGGIARERLTWMEPIGLGFFDVDEWLAAHDVPAVYGEDYFQRYREMAESEIGLRLNAFRVGLVSRYALQLVSGPPASVLDVGIGDGAFLRALESFKPVSMDPAGMDVNPAGVAYLRERGQLVEEVLPRQADIVTFWDSLEHIRDPRAHLQMANTFAIVSIPVFTSAGHAMTSRHFRPDEHFWYFSRKAFVAFAEQEGFEVLDVLATESALGRDSIETFVLRRR